MVIVTGMTRPIADLRFKIADLGLGSGRFTISRYFPLTHIYNLKSKIYNRKVFLHALAPGTYSSRSGHP